MDTPTRVDSDIEILSLLDIENSWEYGCEHPNHPRGIRGHSEDAEVLAVTPLQLSCCGRSGRAEHLCASWIKANPYLRCPFCKISHAFEDCYRILPKGD